MREGGHVVLVNTRKAQERGEPLGKGAIMPEVAKLEPVSRGKGVNMPSEKGTQRSEIPLMCRKRQQLMGKNERTYSGFRERNKTIDLKVNSPQDREGGRMRRLSFLSLTAKQVWERGRHSAGKSPPDWGKNLKMVRLEKG